MEANDINVADINIIMFPMLPTWLEFKDLIANNGKRKGLLKGVYFLV
jgi:hypothetical protein